VSAEGAEQITSPPPPVPALGASGIPDLASHALTDVAINYLSFGPGGCDISDLKAINRTLETGY
jgi:hypothetical protein